MGFTAALSTSDGKQIDLHFGQTRRFLIIRVSEDGDTDAPSYEEVEWREAPERQEGRAHCSEWFDAVAELLRGVDYLFTEKIGPRPHRSLSAVGITVLETPADIAETLEAVARYRRNLHSRASRER